MPAPYVCSPGIVDFHALTASAKQPNPPICPLWYPFLRHPTSTSFARINYAACISLRMREAPGSASEKPRRASPTTATINTTPGPHGLGRIAEGGQHGR